MLVSATSIAESDTNVPASELSSEEVVPVFDMGGALGAGAQFTEESQLRITVYPDALEVCIGERKPVSRQGGLLLFGATDDSTLSSLTLNWTKDQLRRFLENCN